VLLERSQTAELLVVGDHGRGRIASAVAGSVAVSVAARSACPVVVVRGAIPDDALPVVVGIDGTPLSEAAIPFAFDAAAARHVPLVAVHTWLDEINDPALAELVDWQTAAVRAEEVLAERLAGWGEKYPDVPVQRLVARGRVGRALLDQAARAQLAVVGSRGHGEIAGLLLDSVSNALVHGAGCPVAIVRSTK
jgi:nucleotide-binding universal stress UspA family protein